MGTFRLLLALAVVAGHLDTETFLPWMGGVVAVQTFFLLSGFYMAFVLDEKYVGPGSTWLFFTNRALRLYPAYWTVVACTVVYALALRVTHGVWGALEPWADRGAELGPLAWLLLVASQLALFGQDVVLFLGRDATTGALHFAGDLRDIHAGLADFLLLPQAWTLSLELAFYALAPWLLRRRTLTLLVVIGASLAARALAADHGLTHDPWTYRFFPFELALFLAGALAFRAYRVLQVRGWLARPARPVSLALLVVTVGYGALGFPLHRPAWVFYGLTLLALPFLFEASRASLRDARVGELSYPVYISHVFVVSALAPLGALTGSGPLSTLIFVVGILGFSAGLVRFVIEPVERLRQERVARRAARSSSSTASSTSASTKA